MNKLYEEDYIKAIADAIREKNGKTDTYKIADMPQAILDIECGGQPRLPKEYQEVEYIESSGTQYIDTGIKPNENTKISLIGTQITKSGALFGARTSVNENRYFMATSSDLITFFYHSSLSGSTISPNTLMNIEISNTMWEIDDVIQGTFNITNFPDYSIYLFAFNSAGDVVARSNSKIINFKIYEKDILIRNFIPCYRKSDNEIGMYDIVNGVFYTNEGSGTFLKGPNV